MRVYKMSVCLFNPVVAVWERVGMRVSRCLSVSLSVYTCNSSVGACWYESVKMSVCLSIHVLAV
jgi:hypothetical protein